MVATNPQNRPTAQELLFYPLLRNDLEWQNFQLRKENESLMQQLLKQKQEIYELKTQSLMQKSTPGIKKIQKFSDPWSPPTQATPTIRNTRRHRSPASFRNGNF